MNRDNGSLLALGSVLGLVAAGGLARQTHRAGSLAVRAPKGMRMASLGVGTKLHHGTSSEEYFEIPDGPAWFSTSRSVAVKFASWNYSGPTHSGPLRVLTFRVKKKICGLINIQSSKDMDLFTGHLEKQGFDGETPRELAESVCHLGFNGWHIASNYGHEESDTLLCDPAEWLDFQGVEAL